MQNFLRTVGLLTLLLFLCTNLFAQDRTVRGTVKDEKGDVLPGAGISIKGTSISTSTNPDGAFSIQVPEGSDVLSVSFIGMLKQEVSIGIRSVLEIQMAVESTFLDDAVVIGYGSTKRVNLTTAQTTINSTDLERTDRKSVVQGKRGQCASRRKR